MKNVAGYARVSSQAQVNDGTSFEAQKEKIEQYCKKEGFELTNIYADGGISGGSRNRPALIELLKDAKEKKFDSVLFTDLTRLGRNNRDLYNIYYELNEELKIDLVCINDASVNTGGKMGKLMLSILGGISEFERSTIKERTSGGRMIKWKSGQSSMGTLPFGYSKGKEINEAQAKIYKKIVNLYLDDRLSVAKIAVQLSIERIPTSSESKNRKNKNKAGLWRSKTILDMLKNPVYTGEVIYNKKISKTVSSNGKQYFTLSTEDKPEEQHIISKFPALITKERWQQIQDRMKTQRIKPKRIYKEYAEHFLLDGLLVCGECGGKIRKRVRKDPNGKVGFLYHCFWNLAGVNDRFLNNREKCHLGTINADDVDARFFSQIMEMLTHPQKFAQEWFKDQDQAELQAQKDKLEIWNEELNRQIKNGVEGIVQTKHPEDKKLFHEAIAKARSLLEINQKQLEKITKEIDTAQNKKMRLDQFGSKFVLQAMEKGFLESLPFDDKKRVVEAIVCPENGGKIELSYIRAGDSIGDFPELEEHEEKESMSVIPSGGRDIEKFKQSEKEIIETSKEKPCVVKGEFNIDLDKIEAVINSLNKGNLLRLVDRKLRA